MNEQNKEELTFHYNRQRRLDHAPETVKKSYQENNMPNRGFFQGLTANAGLKSMFFAIVFLCIAIFAVTFLGDTGNTATVNGTKLRLKAFLFEETIYITLTCDKKTGINSDPQDIRVIFRGHDLEGAAMFEKEAQGLYNGTQLIFRQTMPDFELKNVTATVNFNKTDTILTVTVDRK